LPFEQSAGHHLLAASYRLDERFRQAAAALGFAGEDQPCTGESCEVRRCIASASALIGKEGLDRQRNRVVAECRRDDLEECALAIRTGAMEQDHYLLADVACEAVAEPGLQEQADRGVRLDLRQELEELRRLCLRIVGDRRQMRHEVTPIVRSQLDPDHPLAANTA
jgi:hypothetical protein